MATQEKQGTRWNEALKITQKYIHDPQELCIVLSTPLPCLSSFSEIEKQEVPLEQNKLQESLDFAENLIWDGEQLIIISDGTNPLWPALVKRLQEKQKNFIFHLVGETRENLSIHVIAKPIHSQNNFVCRVQIQNHGMTQQEGKMLWEYQESSSEKISHAIFYSLAGQSVKTETISISNINQGGQLKFSLEKEDAFLYDNEILVQIPMLPKAKLLLVTKTPQPYLMAALLGYSDFIDQKESILGSQSIQNASDYDLVILCQEECQVLPPGKFLLWATKIPNLPFALEKKIPAIAWNTNPLHPLGQHLDFFSLEVKEAWKCHPINSQNILLHGDAMPLIWDGSIHETQYIYVAFSLENSNFPSLACFPVFIYHCLQWALQKKQNPVSIQQFPITQSNIGSYAFSHKNPELQTKNIVIQNFSKELLILSILCAFFLYALLKPS